MGNCIYCGQKAGLFKSKHNECESSYFEGKNKIVDFIYNSIANEKDFEKLSNDINSLLKKHNINESEKNDLFVQGFDTTIDKFLEDGILSTNEEDSIDKFREHYHFDQSILDKNGSIQKLVKSAILREVLNGKLPENKVKIKGELPFMLEKNETIIWVFTNVEFYEQRTRTIYHGKTQGVSIKIAKGVYYRTSSFKGNPVKIEEMQLIGKGLVGLTDKNIYFSSREKSFKTPYNKLITIDPYEDGIGLQKDGTSSKSQILKGFDGWFTYNLISNLNQL